MPGIIINYEQTLNQTPRNSGFNLSLRTCNYSLLIAIISFVLQVDLLEFASAIRNEFQFQVGCQQGFGPWLDWAEGAISGDLEKPISFEHAQIVEQKACLFLKVG